VDWPIPHTVDTISRHHHTAKRAKQPVTLVIGAGVVGVATAYYLTLEGHKVVCIESEEGPARVTSFMNGGLICPSLLVPWANPMLFKKYAKTVVQSGSGSSPVKVHPHALMDPNFWHWARHFVRNCTQARLEKNSVSLLQLASYSRKCLHDLHASLGDKLDYHQTAKGSLQVVHDAERLEGLIRATQPLFLHKMPVEVLRGAAAVTATEPALLAATSRHHVHGGVFSTLDTSGDVHKFSTQLAQVCKDKVVVFHYNQSVTAFITDTQANTIKTSSPNQDIDLDVDVMPPYILPSVITQPTPSAPSSSPFLSASLPPVNLFFSVVSSLGSGLSRGLDALSSHISGKSSPSIMTKNEKESTKGKGKQKKVVGVVTSSGRSIYADNVVICAGHCNCPNHISILHNF